MPPKPATTVPTSLPPPLLPPPPPGSIHLSWLPNENALHLIIRLKPMTWYDSPKQKLLKQ